MIRYTLDIDPIAKGRPRFTRQGRAYTPAKTRGFENALRSTLRRKHSATPLTGALIVTLVFFLSPPRRKVREYPTCRPDIDNFQKAIMDAGNGILWADDAQIVESHAFKIYDWTTRKGRIELAVETIVPRDGKE